MFGLQKIYEDETMKAISPEKLGLDLLENRLNDIDLFLTDKQKLELKTYFKKGIENPIIFDFSDEQLLNIKFPKQDLEKKIEEVMAKFILDIQNLETRLPTIVDDIMKEMKDIHSSNLYKKLVEKSINMLKIETKTRNDFNQNLQELWGEPLNLLHTLIVINREIGDNYINGEFHIESSMDLTEKLIVRIQARAIQVAEEILILLKNGLADGAEARWRTLHELTVIGAFIAQHGNVVAEQYIDHESIEIYKKAKQHNEYYVRLGATKIPLEEMEILEKEYLALIEKYGKNYKSDYGWASSTLNNKRPTFSLIESSVEYDHYRPYYKSASANIHANSSSVFSRLGLLHEEEDIVLSGSSNSGLASVGQSTALSLAQITTTLLTYKTTMDSLVICEILKIYSDKIDIAFGKVEDMMWDCLE